MARSTLEEPAATPLLVDDRFEVFLDDLVGEGGISHVFGGRDLVWGRKVAAKRLRPELASDEEARWRFEREQRISSVLEHPNVVRYIDANETWLFLEFVDGTTLKRLLADRSPLSLGEAVRMLRGTAAGLGHLHDLGIVHLDVKPQNIMWTTRNRVKLIDLGLAHEFADRQLDRLGTAAYIAPEQITGDPVDGRTDIYSLGCVFFELVTGRPPFVAAGLTGDKEQGFLLDAHRFDEVQPPSTLRPDLPPWVDDVVDRALAKAPDQRFASTELMLAAVDRGNGVVTGTHRTPRLEVRPPDPQPVSAPDPTGPGEPGVAWRVVTGAFGWLASVVWWLLRRPQRMSRRLAMLAATILLVVVLAQPVVSNALLDLAIDVAPWASTQVTSGGLNLRAAPSQDSESQAMLDTGDEVAVTGLPQERDGITWWPVTVDGIDGWVAGEFIDENGLMAAVTLPEEGRDAFRALIGWLLP